MSSSFTVPLALISTSASLTATSTLSALVSFTTVVPSALVLIFNSNPCVPIALNVNLTCLLSPASISSIPNFIFPSESLENGISLVGVSILTSSKPAGDST